MVGWHHQLNGQEFEQAPEVGDGQGSLACCSSWGHKESDMTEGPNNNKILLELQPQGMTHQSLYLRRSRGAATSCLF